MICVKISTSNLIDPYSAAHRTHAPEVCGAASAIMEGHISVTTMDDKDTNMRWKIILYTVSDKYQDKKEANLISKLI